MWDIDNLTFCKLKCVTLNSDNPKVIVLLIKFTIHYHWKYCTRNVAICVFWFVTHPQNCSGFLRSLHVMYSNKLSLSHYKANPNWIKTFTCIDIRAYRLSFYHWPLYFFPKQHNFYHSHTIPHTNIKCFEF